MRFGAATRIIRMVVGNTTGTGEVLRGMAYEKPAIIDYGSIADHTFYRCAGGNPGAEKPKDPDLCEHDKHGECSCGVTGLS